MVDVAVAIDVSGTTLRLIDSGEDTDFVERLLI